jgi:cytochrome c
MKIRSSLLAGFALTLSAPALYASEEISKANMCFACHQLQVKVVGPSWQQIAERNAGNSVEAIVAAIRSGGKDKYGPIPMPPQTAISDANARAMAEWILGGAK